MSTSRILVVCTANICRSPVAEALVVAYLDRYAPASSVEVASAGTHARPGNPAAPGMRDAVAGWGLDLDGHRSRRVDARLAGEHDLVVTMEDAHRSTVSKLRPGLGRRTFTITELAALVGAEVPAADGDGLSAQVAGWHTARARMHLEAPDVADPYGGGAEDYRRTAWELAGLVERIGPALVAAVEA